MQKIKILTIFLMLLLITPITFAQDFNSYENLYIDLSVSFSLSLIPKISNYKIDYLKANLVLNPKNSEHQQIIYLNTAPKATILENEILYQWEKPTQTELIATLTSKVKTTNKIKKLDKKVNFPITNLDPNYNDYLKSSGKIDITPEIKQKALEITSGETDLFVVTYKLAEWIKREIKYDINTLTEKSVQPSSWVLENKQGVCDEITSLFISFLRSLDIPARFVSGTAYTTTLNDFGNHGWAEVYFPDYGWVPFDVTFGQYGWIDPTHIELSKTLDSEVPSIRYEWRSSNLDIQPKELLIKADITDKDQKIEPPLLLSVELSKNKVGPGSYVPLKITLENPTPYYTSDIIFVTIAPALLEPNTKQVLLKPGETKTIFWTIKTPEELDKKYIYTSIIEAQDFFGTADATELTYSTDYKTYIEKPTQPIPMYTGSSVKEPKKVIYKEQKPSILNFSFLTELTDWFLNLFS